VSGMQPKADDKKAALIKVQIISREEFYYAGIKAISNEYADVEIVGWRASVGMAILNDLECPPDVFILCSPSLQLSDRDTIRELKASFPGSKIIVISCRQDSIFAERVFREGASGFFLREVAPTALFDGVRRVVRGELAVEPELAPVLLSRIFLSASSSTSELSELSDREREVFELIGEGLCTRDIAGTLHISIKTVETHQARIKKKLHLNKVTELVHFATQWLTNERIQNL